MCAWEHVTLSSALEVQASFSLLMDGMVFSAKMESVHHHVDWMTSGWLAVC